jgi:hypothetical protein
MAKLQLHSELRGGDWLLRAYHPSGVNQRSEWTICVYRGNDLVRQVKLPMERSTKFGPDGADVAQLNEALAEMMKDLVATES